MILKNIIKTVFVASTLTILTACTNYNLSSVEDATNTVDKQTSDLEEELNSLFDLESELYTTFESDLEVDPELSSFSNNNAEVFTNINNREEKLSSISDLNNDLKEQSDYFGNYDGDELNKEDTDLLSQQLEEFSSMIDTFNSEYTTSLENQKNYFNSLGSGSVSADTFIEGITELNEEHEELVKLSNELNEKFDEALKTVENFKTNLSDSMESE